MIDPRTYFAPDKSIKINKPIFLLGVQCGGLTLVSRMIRRHPSVVSVTGNHKYWSGADEMHTVYGPILPPELTGTKYKKPYPDHPLFVYPRSWTYACDEMLPFYRKTKEDATLKTKKKLEGLIRKIIAHHTKKNRGEIRFTDKSQVYTVRLSLINHLMKESNPKFVLITIDPYSTCMKAASGRAADMNKLRDKLTLEKRLEICAQHWNNSMKYAIKDSEKDGIALLVIKFEDILADPDKHLKKICDFSELSFHEDMIPQKHHKIPFGSRFIDRWYPLEPLRSDKYLKDIKKKHIEIIKKHCSDLAKEFRYYPPMLEHKIETELTLPR